jgi:hypothetical protein
MVGGNLDRLGGRYRDYLQARDSCAGKAFAMSGCGQHGLGAA